MQALTGVVVMSITVVKAVPIHTISEIVYTVSQQAFVSENFCRLLNLYENLIYRHNP